MDKASHSAGVTIVAGGLAGASESFITYPAEFVKTRRQLHSPGNGSERPKSVAILRRTMQQTGIKGIYAGCQTLVISNALKSGVRFLSFDKARSVLAPYLGQKTLHTGKIAQSPWLDVVSGLCAGATESVLVVTPGEALKTRIIHDAASGGHLGRLSVAQLMVHTIRQGGILSLWSGLSPVMCKQGTNSAVRFTTFGAIKEKIKEIGPLMNATTATMLAGAGSGVITVYASMPFDNVKTRMQQMESSKLRMTSVASQMFASEGLSVFWRATTPRLVRLTLSSSIAFVVFDYASNVLGTLNADRIGGRATGDL